MKCEGYTLFRLGVKFLCLVFVLAVLYKSPPVAFAANFVTDSFTDTAGTALTSHTGETGATWAKNGGFSGGSVIITDSNRIRSGVSGASVYYASGDPNLADYSVSADVYVASAAG